MVLIAQKKKKKKIATFVSIANNLILIYSFLEIVRISHCGHFNYKGHQYSGCVQSCDTDGCNDASRMGIHLYVPYIVPVIVMIFVTSHYQSLPDFMLISLEIIDRVLIRILIYNFYVALLLIAVSHISLLMINNRLWTSFFFISWQLPSIKHYGNTRKTIIKNSFFPLFLKYQMWIYIYLIYIILQNLET